jgi:hypothetical protein
MPRRRLADPFAAARFRPRGGVRILADRILLSSWIQSVGDAELVDEWLQVRNELSIEIFLQDPLVGCLPLSSAPEGFVNCVIRGIEHSAASVRHLTPPWDRRMIVIHPSEDVHGRQTRLVTP